MSNKVKDINIKNELITFSMILSIWKMLTLIILKQLKNSLYLIFRYINEYFEEINGNKFLTLVLTNESKEKIKKYEELWVKIRDLIGQ